MHFSLLFVIAALAPWTQHALGHPGEKVNAIEARSAANIRHALADLDGEDVSKCSQAPETLAWRERAMKRRMETFQRLRRERGITDDNHPYVHRRDNAAFTKWAATSHDKTGKFKFTTDTPRSEIFGANSTCILTPDNIIGPYFVQGEQIRSKIVEGHSGVPVHLEMSFVNTQTCKPTPKLLVDIWQCNATGVYSGVSAAGQGGLKSTFLRGV